jgi:hypothetical protein
LDGSPPLGIDFWSPTCFTVATLSFDTRPVSWHGPAAWPGPANVLSPLMPSMGMQVSRTLQECRPGRPLEHLHAVLLLRTQAAGHRRVRLRPLPARPRRQRRPVRGDLRRYLKSSTIVTSHAGVAGWGGRLGDPMLAAAILDRLLHKGIVVAIDGPSYRMRAHQQRSEQLRQALNHTDKP